MTEDIVKALVIKENVWECQLCRNADSSCPVCKVKEREIRNLKKNITELESNTEHLTSELKVNYERITDLEDRLTREKKLRKRLDKDLEELRQEFDQLSKLKENAKGQSAHPAAVIHVIVVRPQMNQTEMEHPWKEREGKLLGRLEKLNEEKTNMGR